MVNEAQKHITDTFSDINTYQKFLKLHSEIEEPVFYLKDLGISSRVLSHWKQNDLLNIQKGKTGWNKFSFSDFIWLKIIQELREFGLPFETIRKVKKLLFSKLILKWNDESLEELVRFGKDTISSLKLSEEDKGKLLRLISHSEFKENIKAQTNVPPSLLVCAIMNVVIKGHEIGFIIKRTGEIDYWMNEFYFPESLDLFKNSFLFISITQFIIDFLKDTTKDKFKTPLIFLTENELELLRKVKQKDLLEVVIKFPKGSGRDDFDIITTKNVGLNQEQQNEICRILCLKNYQSVSIKTQKDGKLYIEKSHRKKI